MSPTQKLLDPLPYRVDLRGGDTHWLTLSVDSRQFWTIGYMNNRGWMLKGYYYSGPTIEDAADKLKSRMANLEEVFTILTRSSGGDE